MIAAPFYLFSFGIIVVIIGGLLSGIMRPPKPNAIDAKMSDEEIAQSLESREGRSPGDYVVFAGLCMVLISIVWRIVRWIF